MSAVAHSISDSTPASGDATPPWASLRICDSLAPLEAEWRAFEARALVTPYQSFDWLCAYGETIGAAAGMSFRFALVHDHAGSLQAALPLIVTQRHGIRFAEFVGGKHANYHMGLYDPGFAAALEAGQARQLLDAIGSAIGRLDAFLFANQPLAWQGVANPLAALAAGPSPSRAYKLALECGDCESTLRRSMSTHARKKLKNKRNRFADFGPSELIQARDEAGIRHVLDAFFGQKARRFAAMGVPDPFADPATRAFLRRAALPHGEYPPAIELYSLDVAGKPVATYVGAVQGERFSGMATSFDMDSPVARTSPGEILLADLILLKCRAGLRSFDLGVGEARYKTSICDDADDLVDSFLPLTAKGRLYAGFSRAKRALKRRIKASPTALRWAQRASGWLRRGRAVTPEEE